MTTSNDSTCFCPLCFTTFPSAGVGFCPEDGGRLLPSSERGARWRGKVVQGKYRIVDFLGAGGMAEVFEADHIDLGRRVAIKLLLPKFASDQAVTERFKQEAHLVSLIDHPNVVAVLDFGSLDDGTLFMVMEMLRGRTLESELEQGPIDPAFAIEVAIQVCEGVQAAHDKNIIHRDIKPANIYLQAVDNQDLSKIVVKVLDLGIAKLQSPETTSSLTIVGTIFGTPEYMSPEQARGERADHRSDIYSIGIVVYQMLLGKVPFSAGSFLGVLAKHLTESPQWPDEIAQARRLPAIAEDMVMTALEKAPDRRYQTVREFQDALIELRQAIEFNTPSLSSPQLRGPVRVIVPTSPPAAVQRVPWAECKGGDNEIAEVAPGTYWVGRRHGGLLECNTYLRVYEGDGVRLSVLIDPGPPRDLPVIAAKVASIIGSLSKVDYLFLNHQDPDVACNAAAIQQLNPRAHVLCSEDTWRLVQFYGLRANSCIAVEYLHGHETCLSTGHRISFVPTPYCHFRGAVMYFDHASRVLFSGDLFGGLSRAAGLVGTEDDWPDVDIFHELYMPSSKALRNAVASIRKIEPKPLLIAPQHGTIIGSDRIDSLLRRMESLDVGVDLHLGRGDIEPYINAANAIVESWIDSFGVARVKDQLQRFAADGSFPNLFVFASEWTIEDIKVEPRLAIRTLVRDMTACVRKEEREAVRLSAERAAGRCGVNLLVAPENR